MNWTTLLFLFFILVILDKTITAVNIYQVQKNFPKVDPYSIEKNPLARWFFQKLGTIGGSIAYGIISLLTIFIVYYFLRMIFSPSISVYLIFLVYGFVVFNNLYFFFKYARIIP